MSDVKKSNPVASKSKLPIEGYSTDDQKMIKRALSVATSAHAGQMRKSGEPYIIHPVAVAAYVAEQGYDAETVTAALLHDVVEDTPVTLDEIRQQFGDSVAQLVDGVTKLGEVGYGSDPGGSDARKASSTENMRKLFLAMTEDLRVIIIKLADRRHNMLTLAAMPPEKQRRKAQQTMDIYVPLADRLGMGALKVELEDLAFSYIQPEAYNLVRKLLTEGDDEAWRYLARLKKSVVDLLAAHNVPLIKIDGRRKHLYSIYRKLAKTDGDISKIYDITALRIIVPTEADCYNVLGVLHTQYKPLIYRIKDYIAVPKPNGYRSLHTTVFALDGRITEIQIRTQDMHDEAEHGMAAHMLYDMHKATKQYKSGEAAAAPKKAPSWMAELAQISASQSEGTDLLELVKVNLFGNRIFAFSPKGDLYELPEGATALDFAFAIHSDIGVHAYGALVNDRMVPLSKELENRDVVEIVTRGTVQPTRDWLTFVRTRQARNRIRAWLRATGRDNNVTAGRQLAESALKAWGYKRIEDIDNDVVENTMKSLGFTDLDSLLAALGEGAVPVTTLMRRLFPPQVSAVKTERSNAAENEQFYVRTSGGRVIIAGSPELPYVLAGCCRPRPGDPIVGYITRGSGITVHHRDCVNLPNEPERWIPASWEGDTAHAGVVVGIVVQSNDRVGLVRDITQQLAKLNINIVQMRSGLASETGEAAEVRLQLLVTDLFQLRNVMMELAGLTGVTSVVRNDEW